MGDVMDAFETMVTARFTAQLTAMPSLAVAVKYRAQEASGMRELSNKQTAPGELGQVGTTISTVRVRADQIDEPDRRAHITVDGKQVYVTECRTSGGIRVLMCSDTQPIEGV